MTKGLLFFLSLALGIQANAQEIEARISLECASYFKWEEYPTLLFDANGNALQLELNEGFFLPINGGFPSHFDAIKECITPAVDCTKHKGFVIIFYSKKMHQVFFKKRIELFNQFCIENNFILLSICQDFVTEEFVNHPFEYAK